MHFSIALFNQTYILSIELWCLVNNSGVAIFSELEWCSMSVIEHMFSVNVLGALRVTKVFLPMLRKSKGRVVIMTSVAGKVIHIRLSGKELISIHKLYFWH